MHSVGTSALWGVFSGVVAAMLALDLGVFHRKAHVVSLREAALWSAVWMSLALGFVGLLLLSSGSDAALKFLAGYLIEKSLSVDNIFVFIVIFSALNVPASEQHRVLYWGILSALVLRAIMIFAGVAMLARFHWLFYVFGIFLIAAGVKLFAQRSREERGVEQRWLFRTMRRLVPSTSRFAGSRFTTIEYGRRVATPLLLALMLIEISDVMFAVDSIPAVLAVTTDPFIVFTSNIFAILGLRSLFFLLARMVDRFAHLKTGLAAVLVFVGTKMTLADLYEIPALISLGVLTLILGTSLSVSLLGHGARSKTTARSKVGAQPGAPPRRRRHG